MWHELVASARQSFVAATKFLVAVVVLFILFMLALLFVLRFVDPPFSAVMLRDRFVGARVRYEWTPIEKISPNLVRAVLSSEDARFCQHNGFDWTEIARAVKRVDQRGIDRARGASTITMQVAKNLFLWTDRSFVRKGLEMTITPMIELMWPKRRIIEVYLNIAQWGPGLFGAGLAARRYFGRDVSELTATQAALLTATLPAPAVRRPADASAYVRRIAERIRQRMEKSGPVDACVEVR